LLRGAAASSKEEVHAYLHRLLSRQKKEPSEQFRFYRTLANARAAIAKSGAAANPTRDIGILFS
jgi:hypothetical protein